MKSIKDEFSQKLKEILDHNSQVKAKKTLELKFHDALIDFLFLHLSDTGVIFENYTDGENIPQEVLTACKDGHVITKKTPAYALVLDDKSIYFIPTLYVESERIRYNLVVDTGNSGDGKWQTVQSIEALKGRSDLYLASRSGTTFTGSLFLHHILDPYLLPVKISK